MAVPFKRTQFGYVCLCVHMPTCQQDQRGAVWHEVSRFLEVHVIVRM